MVVWAVICRLFDPVAVRSVMMVVVRTSVHFNLNASEMTCENIQMQSY